MKPIKPKPGQESVWDYPRPPRLEPCSKHLRILFDGKVLADINTSFRMLETSHPPVYYIPMEAINKELLLVSDRHSFCEFKGKASYVHLKSEGKRAQNAGWYYPEPVPAFAQIKDHLAFYAHMVDACFVNDEKVQAQEGDFYGGWITKDIVGPFKGAAGTWGW